MTVTLRELKKIVDAAADKMDGEIQVDLDSFADVPDNIDPERLKLTHDSAWPYNLTLQ